MRLVRLAIPLALAPLLGPACDGAGGDGGPTGPSDPPSIAALAPVEAREDDAVTITGSGFGTNAADVTVTFRGEEAEVTAVADGAITAFVPDIAPGAAPVVVTVAGRASNEAAFTVLRSRPVLTSIETDPVRQLGTLRIRGENFEPAVAAAAGLRAANGSPIVTIDRGTISSTTIAQVELEQLPDARNVWDVVAQVPGIVAPGQHTVDVEIDGLVSEPLLIDVIVLDPTGIWGSAGGVVNIVTRNGCNFGEPVGTRLPGLVSLEESDPPGQISGFFNGYDMAARPFDLQAGTFDLDATVGDVDLDVSARVSFELGGPVLSFTGTHFFTQFACEIETEWSGGRLGGSFGRFSIGRFDLRDLTGGANAGQVLAGGYDLPFRDLATHEATGEAAVTFTGQWVFATDAAGTYFDTFDGTATFDFTQAAMWGMQNPVVGALSFVQRPSGRAVIGEWLHQDLSLARDFRFEATDEALCRTFEWEAGAVSYAGFRLEEENSGLFARVGSESYTSFADGGLSEEDPEDLKEYAFCLGFDPF